MRSVAAITVSTCFFYFLHKLIIIALAVAAYNAKVLTDPSGVTGTYLEEQYERDPLVVADELSVLGDVEPFSGDGLLDGQVVGVADPADGVRIVAVAVGELGRAPAVDGASDELLGADEKAEADEDDDRVLSTQSVDTSSIVLGWR